MISKGVFSFISVSNAPIIWQPTTRCGNQCLVLNLLLMCKQIIVLDSQKADAKINIQLLKYHLIQKILDHNKLQMKKEDFSQNTFCHGLVASGHS